MSVQHANRGVVKKDLQLYYNREFSKSFRGEATTNIVSNTTDFSGLSYAGYSTEWTSDPTRFTKSYNSTLQTPIGTGATLLTESGTAGYHHLSRFGGSGEGGNSISCYVYSVNGSITNFTIGMLGDGGSTAIFNLVTGTVVSTGARVSNAFITKVSGWLGWYRVGANIGGRTGGWVGAVGLDVQTSYTPSLPYKSMYVTGMQYESKTYCTPFVVGSNRSANTVAAGGGLLDISGNNVNADLTNVSFDSTGYIFGGSQYITVPYSSNLDRNDFTIAGYFRTSTNDNSHDTIVSRNSDVYATANGWNISRLRNGLTTANAFRFMIYGDSTTASQVQGPAISDNVWRHFAVVVDKSVSNTATIYINGILYSTLSSLPVGNHYPSSGSPPLYIGCNKTTADLWNGDIAQILYYQKALTAAEVLQNFNATRKTYGI
jgi:hypothetical protein